MDRVYCLHCGDFMEYDTNLEGPDGEMELVARCKACHHEVYVPFVHDFNITERMRRNEHEKR